GNPIAPAITFPANATSITVGTDGTVSVTTPGQTAAQQVGTLQLALFANAGGLNSVGQNLFLATTASGDPIIGTPGGSEGLGSIEQGFLEQSNVDVVEEFIQMILAQRSYEANSRVAQAADEMLQQLTNLAHEAGDPMRVLLPSLWLVVAVSTGGNAVTAETVALLPEARVGAPVVTLADLLPATASPWLRDTGKLLLLGRAPQPGGV